MPMAEEASAIVKPYIPWVFTLAQEEWSISDLKKKLSEHLGE